MPQRGPAYAAMSLLTALRMHAHAHSMLSERMRAHDYDV